MFERFTDKARRVVVLAQEIARELNHNYIGTEHLLLGILRANDSTAKEQLLTYPKVSYDAAVTVVKEILGEYQTPPTGHIPFTPRGKKTLELSLREALQLGHNYISTDHIMLGLLREGEGTACETLVKLEVNPQTLRMQIHAALGADPDAHNPRGPRIFREPVQVDIEPQESEPGTTRLLVTFDKELGPFQIARLREYLEEL